MTAGSSRQTSSRPKKKESLHFFPPLSRPSKSPKFIFGWVTCLLWSVSLRTGDVKLHLSLNHMSPWSWSAPPNYMDRVWRRRFSVTEMWRVDARLPKINVHYTFCSEIIQDNAKYVKLAFKYFYSPTHPCQGQLIKDKTFLCSLKFLV